MAQKRSRKARREAREKKRRSRWLRVAGAASLLIVMAAAFVVFRGQGSESDKSTEALSTAPQVGALAPDFELVSNKGERVKLSDYRGLPVAVNFMHTW